MAMFKNGKKRSRDSSSDLIREPLSKAPYREDCWSEEETASLIDAWGARHELLNRGNLSRKDWEEVASAVSSYHGSNRRRTAIQCKNRMGTLKKRYKVEKAAASGCSSRWPFYSAIDALTHVDVKPSSCHPAKPTAKAAKASIPPPPTIQNNYLVAATMAAADDPSVWEKPLEWTNDPDHVARARKILLEMAERKERLESGQNMNPNVDLGKNRRKLLSLKRLKQFIEYQIGQ